MATAQQLLAQLEQLEQGATPDPFTPIRDINLGQTQQQIAGLVNDPKGFFEQAFPGLFAGKAQQRIQDQRVRDARSLGNLSRELGVDTTQELGMGVAAALQGTGGEAAARELLQGRQQKSPAAVREREATERRQRLTDQRSAFSTLLEARGEQRTQSEFERSQTAAAQAEIDKQTERDRGTTLFALDTIGKSQDIALKSQQIEAGQFAATSDFANATDAINTTLQVQETNTALGSLQQVIKIREDLGALGPVDAMAHPEFVAAINQFDQFIKVNLFKKLANDTRLSDEDRDFYSSLSELSIKDIIFTGGKVNLAELRALEQQLLGTMDTYQINLPNLSRERPEIFTRPDLQSEFGVKVQGEGFLDSVGGISGLLSGFRPPLL